MLGDSGSITVPPNTQVQIADDGTVSGIAPGQPPIQVGRIKLVHPPTDTIVRGDDGLFRSTAGQPVPTDANVRVVSGSIESSNVNATDALVQMIDLSRQYETQVKLLQTANDDAKQASTILAFS